MQHVLTLSYRLVNVLQLLSSLKPTRQNVARKVSTDKTSKKERESLRQDLRETSSQGSDISICGKPDDEQARHPQPSVELDRKQEDYGIEDDQLLRDLEIYFLLNVSLKYFVHYIKLKYYTGCRCCVC